MEFCDFSILPKMRRTHRFHVIFLSLSLFSFTRSLSPSHSLLAQKSSSPMKKKSQNNFHLALIFAFFLKFTEIYFNPFSFLILTLKLHNIFFIISSTTLTATAATTTRKCKLGFIGFSLYFFFFFYFYIHFPQHFKRLQFNFECEKANRKSNSSRMKWNSIKKIVEYNNWQWIVMNYTANYRANERQRERHRKVRGENNFLVFKYAFQKH